MFVNSGSKRKYDLAVVGHIVLDHISHGNKQHVPQMGSPCVYSSLGARALNASVILGSKVGYDFGRERLSWLHGRGIDIDQVKQTDSQTTSFKIRYVDGHRTMWLLSKCSSLTDNDISDLPLSSAIHIGPIMREIPQSLAVSLTNRNAVTCLDPQGYLRRVLPDRRIRKSTWHNRRLLRKLDVLKVSADEAPAVIGSSNSSRKLMETGPQVIIITKAREGTIMWSKDSGKFTVPAYKTKVRDPTGAGDALAAAFLVTWVRTGDLQWSAAVASAVASFVVEKTAGPPKFGTYKQVEKRAAKVLEGIARMNR